MFRSGSIQLLEQFALRITDLIAITDAHSPGFRSSACHFSSWFNHNSQQFNWKCTRLGPTDRKGW
jgi:hypothetical protein